MPGYLVFIVLSATKIEKLLISIEKGNTTGNLGNFLEFRVALWAHFQGGDVDAKLLNFQAPPGDLLWWTAALKTARERW